MTNSVTMALRQAFAAHREAAEQRGAEAERARICAWLRERWRTDMDEIELMDIADAIERGDHMGDA